MGNGRLRYESLDKLLSKCLHITCLYSTYCFLYYFPKLSYHRVSWYTLSEGIILTTCCQEIEGKQPRVNEMLVFYARVLQLIKEAPFT